MSIDHLPDTTKLMVWIDESYFMVEVIGTGESVAEIGQQLAWLGAALCSSRYELGVAYLTPFLRIHVENALRTVSGAPSALEILCNIHFKVCPQDAWYVTLSPW